ncbi:MULTISPECIES: outer membrane protein assembly factor BamE [Marinobacter]|uniref:outer membrane protein assembly factor BamE n=1 Tax=Marinobacter TaxID=2742 RepID=UPI001D06471D|nr:MULTISPECIES: outer membrane protein assembly factor BamE [Marinobacter]MCK7569072.1 outer membrane protein assembly factor BamE [Marinobacter xestospongiae]UDL05747.1 outer membrane protein assembly factor BamE [Marinobacter sp. CA1]
MQKLAAPLKPLCLLALTAVLTLSGCVFPGVYKINVQQGNIVDQENLEQLNTDMSRRQVHALLGSPAVINPVDNSKEYYVYTFQRAGGDIRKQQIIVYYDGNQYSHHEASLLDETPAY